MLPVTYLTHLWGQDIDESVAVLVEGHRGGRLQQLPVQRGQDSAQNKIENELKQLRKGQGEKNSSRDPDPDLNLANLKNVETNTNFASLNKKGKSSTENFFFFCYFLSGPSKLLTFKRK